jgi:hypothetical protein
MEVTGTIIRILPLQTGQGKNGEWRKQEFILETASQYPKKICMNAWGDKIDQFSLKEGEQVIASIELESREFNNRWYTDVRAWRIQKQSETTGAEPQNQPGPDVTTFYSEEEGDALPF